MRRGVVIATVVFVAVLGLMGARGAPSLALPTPPAAVSFDATTASESPPCLTSEPSAATEIDPCLPGESDPAPSLTLILEEIPDDLPRYDRRDWRHWIDADRDCQNTRAEVLIDESLVPATFRPRADGRECAVESGHWIDRYTGAEVFVASQLDIDHLVALGNAHRSGTWTWSAEDKEAFANDLTNPQHLISATASANRSKGDRGPEEWRPTGSG